MKTNINMKKVIAALTASGILMSGAGVFAAEEVTPISAPTTNEVVASPNPEFPLEITYNGATIVAPVVTVDGVKTVPLRQVMEGLNFTVTWDEATQQVRCNRGPLEIGMTVGQDGYTVAKTAPIPMGAAPYLYNGETTYVPVEVFTDLLGLRSFEETDGYVTIVDPAQVTFKSYETTEFGTRIVVSDPLRGEVVVNISDSTVLGGEGINFETMSEGQELLVGYGLAMTMSIPPQTTAVCIDEVLEFVTDAE